MTQRAFQANNTGADTDTGLHVAVIMDGNGRWARERGLPRRIGHREGSAAVRRVVECAADPSLGIDVLTLYAFSADNWQRPRDEVSHLFRLLGEYLRRERDRCVENGVRLMVTGRRDRLPGKLLAEIEKVEEATSSCANLTLRLAIDYSSRDAIVRAAARAAARGDIGAPQAREQFRRLLGESEGTAEPVRDVDLLIRTGGEQRLSDFMLWESAYAELYFTPVLWPDFGAKDFEAAVAAFRSRERRFGRVLETAV